MQMTLKQRDTWIDALNSGDYPQASGCLRDSSGFCCLGVLEAVEGTTSIKDGDDERGQYTFMGGGKESFNSSDTAFLVLTEHTSKKYKTSAWGPTIPVNLLTGDQEKKFNSSDLEDLSLPKLNDVGITFSEIAAILKQVIEIVPEKEVA